MLKKPPLTDEERKVVRAKRKNSRKKVNVYFNKKSNGTPKYLTGEYFSNKNQESFIYRSSYELAYYYKLEEDDNVITYMYEPFEVEYIDMYKKNRMYRPDLLILYKDGSMSIVEIKPEAMLQDFTVQAKASAAKKYIKDSYKDVKIDYKFITEKNIFKTTNEYIEFLNIIKKDKKAKD